MKGGERFPAGLTEGDMRYIASVTWSALDEDSGFYHLEEGFGSAEEAKNFIASARRGECQARPGNSRVARASIHGMCDDSELLDPLDPKFVYLREYANL